MKRALIFAGFFVCLLQLPVHAQSAAAIADKQDTEERFQRMSADIESLQAANESLKSKVAALEDEIHKLQDAVSHAANNTAPQDDLKRLAEQIQEVDKKREADKQVISEEVQKAIASLTSKSFTSAPPPRVPTKVAANTDTPSTEKGYSYTIQSGDSLGVILKAYNADFKSKGMKTVSMKAAMEANPNVDWYHLHIGQKIIIPKPAEAN